MNVNKAKHLTAFPLLGLCAGATLAQHQPTTKPQLLAALGNTMNSRKLILSKIQSQQFQAAFERCWNGDQTHDVAKDLPLGIPALICAAFAVEVGLKSILIEHGLEKEARGHNLRGLLNNIPKSIREKIISVVSAKYPDFDDKLDEAEMAFVEWRYIYEKVDAMEVNIKFVGDLGSAIQSHLGLKYHPA